jgi:ribose transport system substrate-binding protein
LHKVGILRKIVRSTFFKSIYKRKMKKIILSVIIFSFLLAGCGKKESTTSNKVIGVTFQNSSSIFYKDIEEGIRSAAAQNKFDLTITSAEADSAKQIAQIEEFIAKKVDAIVVCPVSSHGVGSAIKKANEAHIPVFTADIASEEGEVVCHITSDNTTGGKLAGGHLSKLLKNKGKITIINQSNNTAVNDRIKGFKDTLATFTEIQIVAETNLSGTQDKINRTISDILKEHRNLNGIFCADDKSTLEVLDAVKQSKRTKVNIIGYNATQPAIEAILNNTPLKACVEQYPTSIGITIMQRIKDYFSGVELPKVITVRVSLIDQEALSSSVMK